MRNGTIISITVLIVPALMLAAFLVNLPGTEADRVASELDRKNEPSDPTVFNAGQWVYWCISGDPGILSGSTHYSASDKFAKANGLKYSGPTGTLNETGTWPVIFVREDGSFEVVEFKRHVFNWNYGDADCWKRNESSLRVSGNEILVQSKQ